MPCSGNYMDEYDDYGDGGYCVHWEERRFEAGQSRKDHRCDECGAKIPKGERHDYVKALNTGDHGGWWDMRRCLNCSTLAELIFTEHNACPQWGILADIAEDLGYDWNAFHLKGEN